MSDIYGEIMIFVTVGTHEQPFDRLVRYIDILKKEFFISEEIIIQTGFSTYKPRYCTFSRLYTYPEMLEKIKDARIVITHGGPSSFIVALQAGKIPIVVPRQKRFGEHINDHQLDFARIVADKYGNIIVIEKIEDIRNTIADYDNIIKGMSTSIKSNNITFNERFERLVQGLFE